MEENVLNGIALDFLTSGEEEAVDDGLNRNKTKKSKSY